MILDQETIDGIKAGTVRIIRRPAHDWHRGVTEKDRVQSKPADLPDGAPLEQVVTSSGMRLWRVGEELGIVPYQHAKDVTRVRIVALRAVEQGNRLAQNDAHAMGYRSPDAFVRAWVEEWGVRYQANPAWDLGIELVR